MKKLIVDKSNTELKKELESKGFEVCFSDEYSGEAEAIITENLSGAVADSKTFGLVINPSGKSTEEIEKIISEKVYSPLL